MFATLEIVAGPGFEALAQRSHTFGIDGGRIGRTADNDWTIPYEFVHSDHAGIRFFNGLFFIEKHGKNTVAVGAPERDLATGDTYPIKDGDHLFIDDFELVVRVTKERPAPPPQAPPAAKPPVPGYSPVGGTGIHRRLDDEGLIGAMDVIEAHGDRRLDDFLRDRTPTPVAPRGRAEEFRQSPVLNDMMELPPAHAAAIPSTAQPGGALPSDWDSTRMGAIPEPPRPPPYERRAAPPPPAAPPPRTAPPPPAPRQPPPSFAPASARQAPPAAPAGGELALLLAAFGVDAGELAAGELAVLGRALRNSMAGIISVLQIRAEMRQRFRLGAGHAVRGENNPLKAAPNLEDALHEFFRRRAPGTLALDVAVGRAFDEVQWHQLAVLDATESVCRAILGRFDPTAIEERAEHTGRRALGSRAARSWETFVHLYGEIAANPDEAFRKVFGADFARAYDQALERRRAAARHARPGGP